MDIVEQIVGEYEKECRCRLCGTHHNDMRMSWDELLFLIERYNADHSQHAGGR